MHPNICLTSVNPVAHGVDSRPYFLGQFWLTQTVTEARTAGLPGLDVGMVPAFNAFPASSITLAYSNAALLMAAGAKVRMSAAAALYTALAVAPPSEALTLCSSLNAPQKLVAPPMITLCLVAATLGDFAAVGLLFPLGADELAPFGVVELDPVGAVVDFELATLLVPEEHPASTPASTNMRKSRRIVLHPFVVVLRHAP